MYFADDGEEGKEKGGVSFSKATLNEDVQKGQDIKHQLGEYICGCTLKTSIYRRPDYQIAPWTTVAAVEN